MTSRRPTSYQKVKKPSLEEQELLEELKSSTPKTVGTYVLGRAIGEGTFGKVKLAIHKLTSTPVAIKIVDKIHAPIVAREIETWRRMNHLNIAQLYEVLTSENKIYMVTEYVSGGELFEYVTEHGAFCEGDARRVFSQILQAIQYCHDRRFVHRDLKLENILLDESMNVKIIDFGFTRHFTPHQPSKLLETYCGSTAYAAPEMIKGLKYSGPEADIWSLGVILYTLVCGYLPFDDDNESIVYGKIIALDYHFEGVEGLGDDIKSLIAGILVLDPSKRLTMEQMLNHAWMLDGSASRVSQRKPITESDHFNTPEETELLSSMSLLGLNVTAVEESVRKDKCDHLAALFNILLRSKRRSANGLSGNTFLLDSENMVTMSAINLAESSSVEEETPEQNAHHRRKSLGSEGLDFQLKISTPSSVHSMSSTMLHSAPVHSRTELLSPGVPAKMLDILQQPPTRRSSLLWARKSLDATALGPLIEKSANKGRVQEEPEEEEDNHNATVAARRSSDWGGAVVPMSKALPKAKVKLHESWSDSSSSFI